MRVRTTLLGAGLGSGARLRAGGVACCWARSCSTRWRIAACAVEEVEGDAGGLGQAAEGDRLVAADASRAVLARRGPERLRSCGGGLAEVVGVTAHQVLSWLVSGDGLGAGRDAGAADRLDGAVGEPGLLEREDDPAEGVVFLAAPGEPDVVLAQSGVRCGP